MKRGLKVPEGGLHKVRVRLGRWVRWDEMASCWDGGSAHSGLGGESESGTFGEWRMVEEI